MEIIPFGAEDVVTASNMEPSGIELPRLTF